MGETLWGAALPPAVTEDAVPPNSRAGQAARLPGGNLMVEIFGPGPAGAKCGTCVHCVRVHGDHAGAFWKCRLRGITSGTGTDHRKKWDACGAYATGEGEGHTFPEGWMARSPRRGRQKLHIVVPCPHCLRPIGAESSDRVTYYGVKRSTHPHAAREFNALYDEEVARCPSRPKLRPREEAQS